MDYSVIFNPIKHGRQLRVIRRLYTERLMRLVIVQSIDDRTWDVAGWDVYAGVPDPANAGLSRGEYVVPSGMELVARLNNDLDSRTNRSRDRFTFMVMSPFSGRDLRGLRQ